MDDENDQMMLLFLVPMSGDGQSITPLLSCRCMSRLPAGGHHQAACLVSLHVRTVEEPVPIRGMRGRKEEEEVEGLLLMMLVVVG